ncbi:MAG: HAD family hydrolase [Deltaproteobacteria bacterium]|nr:HAD family hydrolase [Deltaproteobacteria bacterium]
MIVLFDIDGTLVKAGGVGKAALELAFLELHGVRDALESVRLDGNTDRRIVEEMFATALGREPTEGEALELSERYLSRLAEALDRSESRYQVLPGATDLLTALSAKGHAAIGLATGNLERGARTKLAPADLNRFFGFGGYGSDARLRVDIVRVAVDRGLAIAEERWGRRPGREEIFVLGDTDRDVHAAREAGVRSVGILAGAGSPDALYAAKPDLVVDSMEDRGLWSLLGL